MHARKSAQDAFGSRVALHGAQAAMCCFLLGPEFKRRPVTLGLAVLIGTIGGGGPGGNLDGQSALAALDKAEDNLKSGWQAQ